MTSGNLSKDWLFHPVNEHWKTGPDDRYNIRLETNSVGEECICLEVDDHEDCSITKWMDIHTARVLGLKLLEYANIMEKNRK